MVEAGAKERRRGRHARRPSSWRTRRSRRSAQAQLELREKVGKPKWHDAGVEAELAAALRLALRRGCSPSTGSRASRRPRPRSLAAELPPRRQRRRRGRHGAPHPGARRDLALIAEKRRAQAVKGASTTQFGERPARAVRRRAGLQGAQVGQARRARSSASWTSIQLPFPARRRRRARRAHAQLRVQDRRRLRLQGDRARSKIAVEKRRPDGRAADEIRADHAAEVGVTPRTHGSGALHARPDPGADARHARHRQGRAAHRRPVARHDEALHAPLQLPALLGRGDGLHARPQAPRHRPRRARRARPRAGDPGRPRRSRTRSAWSPRSWSPTARRRWPRSAARRWR